MSTPDISKESLQKAFYALPDTLQAEIVSDEMNARILWTLTQAGLTGEQIQSISFYITCVLVGVLSKDKFSKKIPARGILSNEIMETLLVALDESVFKDFFSRKESFVSATQTPPSVSSTRDASMPMPTLETRTFGTQSPLEQFLAKDTALQSRFTKLPEKVRTSILSPEVAQAFSTCVRTHDLTKDGFVIFGNGILRVLIGLQNTNDFRAEMRTKEVVPVDKQVALVETVEKSIFKPVRDAIIQALAERNAKA